MSVEQVVVYVKKGILTLCWLSLGLYVFVILASYSPNDPSWSHVSTDMGEITNMGGMAGAWLADILLTVVGVAAYWLVLIALYEAALLWWERQGSGARWALVRAVSYLFLLMSSATLLYVFGTFFDTFFDMGQGQPTEQAGSLVGQTSPDIKHMGVVGYELGRRLQAVLGSGGSFVFSLLFIFALMTMAFEIYWREFFAKVLSLQWLGRGLQQDDELPITKTTNTMHHSDDEHDTQGDEPDTVDVDNSDNRTNQRNKPYIKKTKIATSQIPLPLVDREADTEPNTHPNTNTSTDMEENADWANQDDVGSSVQSAQAGNGKTGRMGSYLRQFIKQTGLQETIAEQVAHAQPNQTAMQTPTQTASPTPQTDTQAPTQPDEPITTVERPAASHSSYGDYPHHPPLPDYPKSYQPLQAEPPPYHQFDHQAPNKMHTNKTHMADDTPWADDAPWQIETSWQSEASRQDQDQAPWQNEAAWQTEASWENDLSWDNEESPFASLARLTDPLANTAADAEPYPSQGKLSSAQHQQVGYGQNDFTPRNTPPVNLLKPHDDNSLSKKERNNLTSHDIQQVDQPLEQPFNRNDAPQTDTTPMPRTPPNVRFDVPDVEQSNHITDMVDDDDDDNDNDNDDVSPIDTPNTVMPDIHDDAAFMGKSRAMQTAKYRANLPTLPPLSILDKPDPDRRPSYTAQELQQLSELLEIKLQDFNIKADVVNAIPGPVVTRFEVELAAGVKASKVVNISRDLARSLSMASLRVVEVIPGKPYIGIEVPNRKREMVRLIELLATDKYQDPKGQISMAMGKDIGGKPIITDLARAPHMLVAGTTGSGKSVLVNSMLLSMVLKYTPEQLRLILIDPKQLELANYNDIPHLLTPVVTDMTEAASSLSWCVAEMERRYQLMSLLKVRKLKEFNKKVIAAQQAGTPIIDPLWRPNDSVSIDKAPKLKTLPLIVIVADEFADMIMQVGKQAEELITRLAQKSRAAGIHLMLATQRPSVDVITGLIKANVPVRAALRVNSKVDSRTILDSGGAEDMLGNGDMLFLGPGQIEPERVHGAFVSDEEVNRVCEAWRERGAPDYIDSFADNFDPTDVGSGGNTSGEDDDLYNEAVAFVMETRKVSASSLQRKFSIGYNRAARIVDSMEEAGLISPMDKSGKRELLF